MKNLVKTAALALLLAFFVTGCAVTKKSEPMFKGKTEAEWQQTLAKASGSLEKVSTSDESVKGFNLVVEGESYLSTTMTDASIKNNEFSGGTLFGGAGSKQATGDYRVSYKISVPVAGYYDITALTSRLSYGNTTNYFLYTNGEKALNAAKAYTTLENHNFPSIKADPAAMRTVLLNPVYLTAGENELAFVLDTSDTTPRSTYLFYIDYFSVKPSAHITAGGSVSYSEAPFGEYSELSTEAQKLSVFTNTWEMQAKLSFSVLSAESQTLNVSVEDYDSNTVFSEEITIDGGEYSYTLSLGNHPTGSFTLRVRVGSEESFKCVYIVTPDIQARTQYDSTPFATDFAAFHTIDSVDDSYMYAAACKLAGVSWVRERYESYAAWYEGSYDFSRSDAIYNNIDKCGLNISSIIMGSARNGEMSMGELFSEKQLSAYKYVKDFAERYEDVVDAVEIWNELDWQQHYSDTADIYASYYKAMVCAVLDANPAAFKVFSALCQKPSENDWLEITAENDIFDYTDAFNFHYHIYDDIERPVTQFINGTTAGELTSFVNKYAPSLPSWCTEAGILLRFKTTSSEGISASDLVLNSSQQKTQSNYMITSAVQSLAAGTDRHFWFIAVPNQENGGTFGSFRYDNTPYPSVATEAVMTELLGKGIYKGKINALPSGAEGHIFNNGSDDVAVLWAENDTQVTINTDKTCLKSDIMGNKSLLVAENGKITLNASSEPVYIVFDGSAPSSLFTPSTLPASAEPVAKTDFTAGERVVLTQIWGGDLSQARTNGYTVASNGSTVSINIANFNDVEVSGTVSGVADGYSVLCTTEGQITIPPYSEATVTFNVSPAPGSAQNTFIRFNGEFNGQKTSTSAAKIHVG